jgi:hypothetical protein
MADNVEFQHTFTATPPKDTIVGADEIDGVVYQRMKLIHGADGVNEGDISALNPLPVNLLALVTVNQSILSELVKMNKYLSILVNEEILE